jgi:hypothetical protein
MCDKCVEINERIARYRRINEQIMDQQFNDRTKALIAELELEKAGFHPENGK